MTNNTSFTLLSNSIDACGSNNDQSGSSTTNDSTNEFQTLQMLTPRDFIRIYFEMREIVFSKFIYKRKMIGDYILGGVVGSGGSGMVYDGYHQRKPEEKIAIKVQKKIKPSLFSSSKRRQQYINMKMCGKLEKEIAFMRLGSQHQNIITLYDVIHTPKATSFIMEKADVNLKEFVGLTLPEKTISSQIDILQELMKGILQAVAFCHSHGIAHRDIKPVNILVCKDESNPRFSSTQVRLCDFGISTSFSTVCVDNGDDGYLDDLSHAPNKDVWCTGTSGTPGNLSPELLAIQNNITSHPSGKSGRYEGRNADMWSIGKVLDYMMYKYKFDDSNLQVQVLEYEDPIVCSRVAKRERKEYNKDNQICRWDDLKPEEMEFADNLIDKLMDYTPTKRLTAPLALQHDWITFYDHVQDQTDE